MSRLDDLLDRYGECCRRTTAAKILGKSPVTIGNMIKDGRLRANCGGTMVDVRSICEYIETPTELNEQAHALKMMRRSGSAWHV